MQVEQTEPPLAPSSSHHQLVQALRSKQKTSKGASAYARYLNRPAGRHFAALAYRLHMTPNGVTAVSALCSFAGIGLIAFAPATPVVSVVIALLLVLGYALDSADGQLARLRGGGSFAGEWLDHVVDAVKMASLHLAVLVAWYQGYAESSAWLAVPLLYQLLAVVLFFAIILTDQMRRAHRGSTATRLAGEGSSSVLYSLAVLPTEYGVLCLAFLLWFIPPVFSVVYAVFFGVNACFLLLALPRWYREMRSYGAADKA
ncbi:CDP-alcohol phosphatidyltransferase family protein [Arthrobacter sp. MP_M4]|uniref:CDP-alcohol phosphatidyltransferase family protein n=1 Tax=Arthrobacter sp. MP_M4 TaxID=3071714 RepID=UPI002DFA514D|nr:phosphatidylglycerophosphate synthase [Arthrobacter sp. MP_M4]